MIGAGEADSVSANLPRIRLEIDVDLQLDPSRPIQQEQEQYQSDHLRPPFPLQLDLQPRPRSGVLHLESYGSTQTRPCKCCSGMLTCTIMRSQSLIRSSDQTNAARMAHM